VAKAGGDSSLKLVTDANVWIDLDNGGLVALTFALPYEFASPNIVVAELQGELGGLVADQGLRGVPREMATSEQWFAMRRRYARPSDADIEALLLAIEWGSGLLTGDKDLRRAAEAAGLVVHGVLWVLDELVGTKLLAPRGATRALRAMLEKGAHLPEDECRRRMIDWGRP